MDVIAPLNPWERALVVKHIENLQARVRGRRLAFAAALAMAFLGGVLFGIELAGF